MPYELHLQILDQRIHLRTDGERLATWLEHIYSRFLTPHRLPTLEVIARTRPNTDLVAYTNTALHLTLHDLPVEQQANIVIRAIYAHDDSHFIFHAGVVARAENQGVYGNAGALLVGHSGQGKTTLTLELVRRGWHFLSDEIGAMSQNSGILTPFPRNVHLRPNSRSLLGLVHDNTSDDDLWSDISQLFPDQLSGPVPARILFLLEGEQPSTPAVLLTLDRADVHLVTTLHALPTVTAVDVDNSGRRMRLRGDSLASAEIYYQIERSCREHNSRILDLSLERRAPVDFATQPAVTPMAPAEAAIALFPYLLSGRRSQNWFGPWQGNPLALFRSLAVRLSTIHCFRLQVGLLSETANLVERTVGECLQA